MESQSIQDIFLLSSQPKKKRIKIDSIEEMIPEGALKKEKA